MKDPKGPKKSKNRKDNLNAAADVIQSLLQNSKGELSRQFTRWRLWHFWEEVVGPTVGEHSNPVGYHRCNLYVWVDNSVRLQEFVFMKKVIITKINKHLGKVWVKNIHFTLDRKGVPANAEVNPETHDFLAKSSPSEDGDPELGR